LAPLFPLKPILESVVTLKCSIKRALAEFEQVGNWFDGSISGVVPGNIGWHNSLP